MFPHVREARTSSLVKRTLRGALRSKGSAINRKTALTTTDLRMIIYHPSTSTNVFDSALFHAMLLTGFFGLLRLGEMTQSADAHLADPLKAIHRSSLHITSSTYQFLLPANKTDPFFEGNRIIIRATSDDLNPRPIFLDYVAKRDHCFPFHSQLFLTSRGLPPTSNWFLEQLHRHVPRTYGGQSLRSGGATWLASIGTPSDVIQGKVIIVTGANTGVGKETAKALLTRNAKVYFATRSEERAKQAIEDLKRETGKEGVYLRLDLADLASVKSAANEFLSKEQDLHVLFNNAGVMLTPIGDVTAQEYDLQFGTNVLGHFYFTSLLLPALTRGASSSSDGKARVVTTSSAASYLADPINFNTLKDGPTRKRQLSGWLYNQSKLGNVLVSNGFAKRYGDKNIVFTTVHPGSLDSDLFRHLASWQVAIVRWLILHPSSFGALTQLYAGTMEEGANLNGKWLRPWARVGEHPSPLATDEKLIEDLWKWCEDQVANL